MPIKKMKGAAGQRYGDGVVGCEQTSTMIRTAVSHDRFRIDIRLILQN